MSSKADKLAARALVQKINAAVDKKDAASLQSAYADLIKLADLQVPDGKGETQGYR